MTTVDDLIAFLRAQINKDAAHAERLFELQLALSSRHQKPWSEQKQENEALFELGAFGRRLLAEVDAKRRIIEAHPAGRDHHEAEYYCTECGPFWRDGKRFGHPCETLRLLALPYADHPDYREHWRSAT